MAKRKISSSEPEESESESESESEEKLSEKEEVNPKQKQQGISEYEKQRLSRIAENRARMEALGLSKMASSLMGSSRNSSKLKGKRKVVEDDEDYRPGDEDDNDDDVGDNDDKLDGDDDEDFPVKKTSQSQSRKNKVKNKVSKPKKVPIQKHLSSSDYVDDEDELMKAIALSLQDSREVSGAGAVHTDVQDATFTERKGNARLKRKKLFTSRVQMTEDEMIVHFFQFDGAGKGSISMRDLRRVAIAHDFMWTDKELSDMIHCLDSGSDGKLNLDDFRKIVSRCNMLQSSENS